MSIIDQLASSLGRRDEVPNQELAEKIATAKDKKAVKELADNLGNKSKDIQSDCIKVLYEIGGRSPALLAPYYKELAALLDSKNNRMVWGAMTAIDSITTECSDKVYKDITKVLEASDKGSVITKDHAVAILIKLAGIKAYTNNCLELLLDQLKSCPPNQLPMYAENALSVIQGNYKSRFITLLQSRMDDMEKESKRKRVEKVIKKLDKK